MPFIVNIICQFGVTWGRVTVSIYQPTYFKVIHGLNSAEVSTYEFRAHIYNYCTIVLTPIILV